VSDERLDFAFAPVPVAWAEDRSLSDQRYRLLGFLYGQIDRRRPNWRAKLLTVELSIERISTAIGWRLDLDSLRRDLGRMREEGRFDYETTPGKHGAGYTFELPSGECPGRNRSSRPGRNRSSGGSAGDVPPVSESAASGEEKPLPAERRPGRGPTRPGRKPPAKPHEEPSSGAASVERVRGPQRPRGNALCEGELSNNGSEEDNDQVVGRGTSARKGVALETDDDRLLALVAERRNREIPDRPWADLEARASRNGGLPVRVIRNSDGSLSWFDPDPPLEGEEAIIADCRALDAGWGLARFQQEATPA